MSIKIYFTPMQSKNNKLFDRFHVSFNFEHLTSHCSGIMDVMLNTQIYWNQI